MKTIWLARPSFFKMPHHHLRVSASDDENICLKVVTAMKLPCGRLEQLLILLLQVQILEGGA